MTVNFADLVRWMKARHEGPAPARALSGWSIDTRTLEPGDVYFALRGEAHDGHDFVAAALERGAACAVVENEVATRDDGRVLRVANTLFALQELGRQARGHWGGDIVGVTGSAGKTTTKDVIAQLLSVRAPVGKTVGNLNNHIGVPLSLLRIPDQCRVAVLEMGMNHAGEIRELATIARPRVGVVTNVGYAHVEFFRSIDGVAAAKRELIEALPVSGTAVLNAEDARVRRFAAIHVGRSITYGFGDDATVRAEDVELLATGTRFRCSGSTFETPLTGRHGVLNALAGIATAGVFGIKPAELTEAARTIPIGKMRGERLEHNGITILNDAYNANPEAMLAMLDVLAATPGRRHIAVLGEMLELGAQGESLHRETGKHAAAHGLDLLIGIRGNARAILDGAIEAGLPPANTLYFEDSVKAGTALQALLRPGDAILLKGSRGVRVERALEALLEVHA